MGNTKSIDNVHIYWTKPKENTSVLLADLDVFLMMVSALTRKYQSRGKRKIYLDTPGKLYLEKLDCLWPWEEVNTEILDGFSRDADFETSLYVTAGKCHLIATLPPPFLFIDHDLILFEELDPLVFAYDLAYAHDEDREKLPIAYPELSEYEIPPGYQFDLRLAWNHPKILNSSILYINSVDFQKNYENEFKQIMANNFWRKEGKPNYVAQFNLSDQRLLNAVMRSGSYRCYNIMNSIFTDNNGAKKVQKYPEAQPYELSKVFHAWGLKNFFNGSRSIRKKLMMEIIQQATSIVDDNDLKRLQNNPLFADYFKT